MNILALAALVAVGSLLATLFRDRVVTLSAAAGVALASYLFGLHFSVAGGLVGLAAGFLIGIPLAIAVVVALAVTHPAVAVLDIARRYTGHSRLALAVAMVRLLVAGRRILLR